MFTTMSRIAPVAAYGPYAYTDFSEYVTGSPPADWTKHTHPSRFTLNVEADGSSEGGKSLRVISSGGAGTDSGFALWGEPDPVLAESCEILMKVTDLFPPGQDRIAGARFVPTQNDKGQAGWYRNVSSGTFYNTTVGTIYSPGGVENYKVLQYLTVSPSDTYYLRMRYERTGIDTGDVKVNVWPVEDSEPVGWQVQQTGRAHIQDSFGTGFGIFVWVAGTNDSKVHWYAISAGTDSAIGPI